MRYFVKFRVLILLSFLLATVALVSEAVGWLQKRGLPETAGNERTTMLLIGKPLKGAPGRTTPASTRR